jgi:hypothetical protein
MIVGGMIGLWLLQAGLGSAAWGAAAGALTFLCFPAAGALTFVCLRPWPSRELPEAD